MIARIPARHSLLQEKVTIDVDHRLVALIDRAALGFVGV